MSVTYPETVEKVHLSELLGREVSAADGQSVGRLADVIVTLPEASSYPMVAGLVVKVGGRHVFVHASAIGSLGGGGIALGTARIDVRPFERRPSEVLLRADVLGHRLIDVTTAKLVRAHDVELGRGADGWYLLRLDIARRRRLFGLLGVRSGGPDHETRDWRDLEALIGHATSATARNPLARLRRLRPAQIADLVEEADPKETDEILQAVHADAELEADVFEELEADRQVEVLRDRTDAEVAEVLSHMRPDDAADLIVDLPQARRVPVLELLSAPTRIKIRSLLGFNPATAGGLMTPDFLALSADTRVSDALEEVRRATHVSPEVLASIFAVSDGVLAGSISLAGLLQSEPGSTLTEVAEADPVHVHPDADITELAIRMTDFNLVSIPVLDDRGAILGVVTVDDVLEVTLPEGWRRREEGASTSDRPRPSAEPDPEIPERP